MAIESFVESVADLAVRQPQTLVIYAIIGGVLVYLVANEFIRRSARIPMLSGPPGLPLIGNLAQIRVNAAEQYRLWAKRWGPVYQIQLGNVPIVVVNSASSARVLFGQHAQALSSRPEFYTFHKVCLSPHAIGLMRLTSQVDPVKHCRHYDWHLPLQ